eukprot:319318-Prymnesium_polylepis.1
MLSNARSRTCCEMRMCSGGGVHGATADVRARAMPMNDVRWLAAASSEQTRALYGSDGTVARAHVV